MRCENCYCVYWEKDRCILDEISLDMRGCCDECAYVVVDEAILLSERDRLLESYGMK